MQSANFLRVMQKEGPGEQTEKKWRSRLFGERDFGSKEWETETGREVVCGERQPLGLARRSPAVQPNPRPSSVACSEGLWLAHAFSNWPNSS